jgi:hypothetical protein
MNAGANHRLVSGKRDDALVQDESGTLREPGPTDLGRTVMPRTACWPGWTAGPRAAQTSEVDSVTRREQLRVAFANLDRLVGAEGYVGTPWILRIRTALDYLRDVETGDFEAVGHARRIFLDMHSGGRNFGDFLLWREGEPSLRLANQELESAKSRIWALFED